MRRLSSSSSRLHSLSLHIPPVPSMITCLGPPVVSPEKRGLWVLLVRVVRVGHACLWLILNMHARILLCVL